MKICYFDDFKLGIVKGDNVVDVSAVVKDIPHTGPHDLINGLIERFDAYRGKLEAAVAKETGVPLKSVRLRSPLPRPINIDCMAVNYMEDGTRSEPAPINAFHKSPSGVIGDGDTMVLQDIPATIFEGEAELALVIGKRATNVKAADAMQYIFGYVNFIDGSARGLPPPGNVFYQMKSRDTFAPIGPYIVTADEIPDPHNVPLKSIVNGQVRQDGNTNDMIYKFPRIIEYYSVDQTMYPGDIFASGDRDVFEFDEGGFHGGGNFHLKIEAWNSKRHCCAKWARRSRASR